MKTIMLIVIYFGAHALFFLILSLFGTLWYSYQDVIQSRDWFIVYTMFLGWWMSIFPAREYYLTHEHYFEKVF